MNPWHIGIDFAGGELIIAVSSATAGGEVIRLGEHNAIPATVALAEDGQLLVGDVALGASSGAHRLALMLDRMVGTDEQILPGLSQVTADDALAAIFKWVIEGVAMVREGSPDGVCIAYPTRWRAARRRALIRAAETAGMRGLTLVPASTAAANRLVGRAKLGDIVAVYMLGGMTSEVAVLRRVATGWIVLGRASQIDFGSADLDRCLLDHVLAQRGGGARESAASLAESVRRCREALSLRPTAVVEVPGDDDVRVTRDEAEELFTPLLRASMDHLASGIDQALSGAEDLAAVVVTGAATRLPLVDRLVSEAVGRAPTASDERYSDVAIGAAELSLPSAELPSLVPLVPIRPPAAEPPVAGAPAEPAQIAQPGSENVPNMRSTFVRPLAPRTPIAEHTAESRRAVPRESRSQSLRRTGALIAVAAVVVVALYLLAYPATLSGLFGVAQPATSAPPTAARGPSTPTGPPADPAVVLAAAVPAPPARNCRPAPLDEGDVAALDCEAPDVDDLWYAMKLDQAALDGEVAAIRSDMEAAGVIPDAALCGDTWRYEGESQEVTRGELICFNWTDGAAFVYSTLGQLLVIDGMQRSDGNLEELVNSWRMLAPQEIDGTGGSQ